MNRKIALIKIKSMANQAGFTLLDVLPAFCGVSPSQVENYLDTAYKLDFIQFKPDNMLVMYPTKKLLDLTE